MGTTAEKLAYLKETKNQIKQALETPSNVMRDYANWIKKYVDNQPTSIVSDGICANALDVPLVSLGVDGNSEQKQYEGTNYFNANVIPSNTGIIVSDNGKTIKMPIVTEGNGGVLTSKKLYELCPNLKVDDVVYLRFGRNLDINKNGIIYLLEAGTDWGKEKGKTITQEMLNSRVMLYGNRYVDGETEQCILTDFRIVKNSDDEWEPYVGGQPSPNPEYPQDIEVIKGFEEGNQYGLPHGCIGLEQSGKNWFDINQLLTDSAFVKNSDGTYTFTRISGHRFLPKVPVSIPANTDFSITAYDVEYSTAITGDIFSILLHYTDGSNSTLPFVTSEPSINYTTFRKMSKSISSIELYFESGTSDGDYIKFSGVQLEFNPTSTPYEPYHSPKLYPINLNGNSIAKVGDVKDLLKIYRNGDDEIEKNINEVVLDGTRDWRKNADSPDGNYISFYITEYWIGNIIPICDKFVGAEWNIIVNENGEFCWSATESCGFRIRKDRLNGYLDSMSNDEKIELFKSWLSIHKPTVKYQLEEPQTIKLPSIEPIELWEGTNNFKLITNLDTTFEMEYVVNKNMVQPVEENTATEVAESEE